MLLLLSSNISSKPLYITITTILHGKKTKNTKFIEKV